MTSGDQPFRRPPSGADGERIGSPVPGIGSQQRGTGAEPVILDPEFHQSVWKPWQTHASQHATVTDLEPSSPRWPPAPASRLLMNRRRALWLALAGMGAVGLATALLLPSLLLPDPPVMDPPAMDLPTRPVVAWSAEYGEACLLLDADHTILSNNGTVWSLDLRTGQTQWSVDLANGYSVVNCLPGSNLVATSDVTASGTVLSITLLDGSTGARVGGFPGDETVQVVPLGSNIGLVAPDHMLSMVTVENFDTPVWSRPLPGPDGSLERIWVREIDTTTVQLQYSVSDTCNEYSAQQSEVLMTETGESPAWAEDASKDTFHHERVGDVILASSVTAGVESVTASDLQGRELWTRDDASTTVGGARLFLSTQSNGMQSWSRLQEVDPRDGSPVGDESFEAEFNYCFITVDGRPAILQEDALTLLDEGLEPQTPIPSTNFHFLFQGSRQMYLGQNIDASGEAKLLTMTAIDVNNSNVLWSLDLEWGQSVDQLGRHLVLVDSDGETIHGLKSSLE